MKPGSADAQPERSPSRIRQSWAEQVVASLTQRLRDRGDSTAERSYAPIAERGGRVLRVVVNTSSDPRRVVTVFFDRRMRGEP